MKTRLSLSLLAAMSLPAMAQTIRSATYDVLQPTAYAKDVLDRIQQVEQHLAANIRTPDDRDWTLQDRMKHHHIHGLSVAVVHNHKVEWAKAYGWADSTQSDGTGRPAPTDRPVTTETRFLAGLISESLHAVGMLTLVQDKKIDLYADINQYLTTWRFPYDSIAKGKKINTVNLLGHTAGLLPIRYSGYAVGTELPAITQVLDGQEPATTKAVRSRFEPDIRYLYSGGGPLISQQMLMDLTHRPYDQYMADRVLKPMGMTQSSFTQPPGKQAQLATGYDLAGKEIPGHYRLFPEQAAAGLWTTPTDLARYIVETQLAYLGKSSRVLTPEMTRLRLTPQADSSAALGVSLTRIGPNRYFTNGRYGAGFSALYYGSLTDGNGLVIMTNSDNGSVTIIPELVNSIARVYDWTGFYKPTVRNTVAVSDSVLETYVGDYQLGGTVFTVTREKNRLFEHVIGGTRAELLPETPTRFFFQNIDAEVEFVPNASGRVTKRTMVYNGQKTEMEKIN